MPTSERLLTCEDLYALSAGDNLHHELEAGVLVSEPPPGFRHGQVVATLAAMLAGHVRALDLGAVLAGDSGYVLSRSPDTVRGPDVSFVSGERLRALEDPAAAFPGPPDLAVEVVSPSDTRAGVHAKVADYLAAGSRLVWVVDPERRTVTIYRSLLSPRVLAPDGELDGEDIVPGFRTAVAALFQP